MRTFTALIIFLLTGLSIVAQKNFEGKIIYKMNSVSQDENAVITAYFGKQKIKAAFKQGDSTKNRKNDLLIDFDKGIVYYINPEKNTYRTKKLLDIEMDRMPALKPLPGKNKPLLGYTCSAYITTDTSKNEYMTFTGSYCWYADSLYFNVKEEYSNIDMVPLFTNGRSVGMGMQMNFSNGRGEVYVELTPVSIIATAIPDSVFSLGGLQLEKNHLETSTGDSTQLMVDSAAAKIQEAAAEMLEKAKEAIKDYPEKSPSGKRPSKNTRKQPAKTPSTKPKE